MKISPDIPSLPTDDGARAKASMEEGMTHFWHWRRKGASDVSRVESGEKSLGGLMKRIDSLRDSLRGGNPAAIASRTGAMVHSSGRGGAELRLAVWGRMMAVRLHDFVAYDLASGNAADPGTQALLMYYLATSDGSPESNRWISFSELPDGMFYQRAFQGYTGDLLARAFGNDLGALSRAAVRTGGSLEPLGELAYSFRALPRVRLALVYWRGVEELAPSARVLFVASAPRHLPTDVCAILGASLARRLMKAGKGRGVE